MSACAAAARAAVLSSAACRGALRSQARSQAVRVQAVPARMFFGGLFSGGAKREVSRHRSGGGTQTVAALSGARCWRDAALKLLHPATLLHLIDRARTMRC